MKGKEFCNYIFGLFWVKCYRVISKEENTLLHATCKVTALLLYYCYKAMTLGTPFKNVNKYFLLIENITISIITCFVLFLNLFTRIIYHSSPRVWCYCSNDNVTPVRKCKHYRYTVSLVRFGSSAAPWSLKCLTWVVMSPPPGDPVAPSDRSAPGFPVYLCCGNDYPFILDRLDLDRYVVLVFIGWFRRVFLTGTQCRQAWICLFPLLPFSSV